MGENLCQLYIGQGTDNASIEGVQNTKLSKPQWPNEEMGKLSELSFLKGRSQND
jgi:hypothetical protein